MQTICRGTQTAGSPSMDPHDDDEMEMTSDVERTVHEDESHATTGGAAAAGALTGGVIGLVGGPVGAAIGAVGGAIVGAAAERMMHAEDHEDAAPYPTADTSPTTEVTVGHTDVHVAPPPVKVEP